MKFKKFAKYSLMIIVFLLASYFIFCLISNHNPKDALPPKPQVLVSLNKPKKLLNEYEFLLKDYPELKNIKKFLPFVPNFQIILSKVGTGYLIIVDTGYMRGLVELGMVFKSWFLDDKKGIHYEEYPQLKKYGIYALKDKRATLGYFSHQRNLLLFSNTTKPLRVAYNNLNTDHDLVDFSVKGDISILFNTDRLLKKVVKAYPQLSFLKEILNKNQSGNAQVYFEDNIIKTKLVLKFKKPETYKEKVYSRLLNMSNGDRTISDITPYKSGSFVSFSIEDFKKMYNYFIWIFKDNPAIYSKIKLGTKALAYISKHHLHEFFAWMGQEMGAVTLSDYDKPVLVIKVKDSAQFKKTFKQFIGDKVAKVGGANVYEMDLPGMFGFLKSIFAPSIDLPYFTIFKNEYLLISDSAKNITNFIKGASHVKIADDGDFQLVKDNISSKSHIKFFMDLGYGYVPFMNISPEIKKIMKHYMKMGGGVTFKYPEIHVDLVSVKTNRSKKN